MGTWRGSKEHLHFRDRQPAKQATVVLKTTVVFFRIKYLPERKISYDQFAICTHNQFEGRLFFLP